MTVIVVFHCTDGAVIAADSMLTPSMGGIDVGHHHGQKLSIIAGPQLYAFAGDLGQSERVRIMADGSSASIPLAGHPIDWPLTLCQSMVTQFQSTGVASNINVAPVLAFAHGGAHHTCVFEGALQPRLLDEHHYYAALGSGKLSADPFLRFLTDVFCTGGRPNVAEATFLAAWTVQHVIDVNPGGVAAPVRIGTFKIDGGVPDARILPNEEIGEHLQAVESSAEALRAWRDDLQSGSAADDVPDQPVAPQA